MVMRNAGAASIVLLMTAIGGFSPASVASTTEIVDPVVVQVNPPVTQAQMSKVVKAALAKRGWALGEARPGYVEGTLVKPGSYTVKIALTYDGAQVSIKYLESEGLSYDAENHTIHANYNKWMRMLSSDIQTFAVLLGGDEPSASAPAPTSSAPAPAVQPVSNVPPVSSTPAAPAPAPAPALALAPAAPPLPAVTPPARIAGATFELRAGTVIRGRPTTSDAGQALDAPTAVTLKVAMQNADGRWWFVTGAKKGWIQENELAASGP